jgi:hypothetical protein
LEWWSAAQKIEHLHGVNFGRVHEYLAWSPDEIDPHWFAAQKAQCSRSSARSV